MMMANKIFKNLESVSKFITDSDKKVTLLYAFNATGKTRLSMTFKNQLDPAANNLERFGLGSKRVLYFNSFTEDLFTWENDLENDENRYLIYNKRTAFGDYINAQSVDQKINKKFNSLVNPEIFVTFESIDNDHMGIKFHRGDEIIKISRGEERLFIWCIFMIIAEVIVSDLKEDKNNEDINNIDYIYIDDPISSLDENYTITAALDLANFVKNSQLIEDDEKENGKSLNFVISTHHALFFEVLSNQIKSDFKSKKNKPDPKMIKLFEETSGNEGGYVLTGTSTSPFSYHNYIFNKIKYIVDSETEELSKYHFNLMRNLLEKTALFLGYSDYRELIPMNSENRDEFIKLLNEYSHGTHSDNEPYLLNAKQKFLFKEKFNEFKERYHWQIDK